MHQDIKNLDRKLGLPRDEVFLLSEYDAWRNFFLIEKERLALLLAEWSFQIEHIGSTAIPKLAAKPVLDIALGIESIDPIAKIIEVLNQNGYEHLPERGGNGRIVMVMGSRERRIHHLHIECIGSQAWNDHIDFRNILLYNDKTRSDYQTLKEKLAVQYYNNRNMYTELKAAFIQRELKEHRLKKNGQAYVE